MPTIVPSTPVHVSTRRSSKRKELPKAEDQSCYATLQENVELNDGRSPSSSLPADLNPDPPTETHNDGEDDGTSAVMTDHNANLAPIRKASFKPTRDRILDRYLVTEANWMCLEILDQINANASSEKIFKNEDKSPGTLTLRRR
jgi:hypothetical protein